MDKPKFACADYTFPLLPHDKVLDVIKLLECPGIDIGLFSGRSHLRPESEFENVKENARRLKQQLEERELIASDVFLQLDTDLAKMAINHPDESIRRYGREQFLHLIEYATELGADHITCLPGMFFPDVEEQESLDLIHEELNWRVGQVKDTGLNFGVEAHIGSPFINPASALKLVETVDGLQLTLDYTHFIRDGYEQYTVNPLMHYTNHFHARGAKKGRLQANMSENEIDYSKVVQAMKQEGYRHWVGLEYIYIEWEGCNEADTISETIRLRETIENAWLNDG